MKKKNKIKRKEKTEITKMKKEISRNKAIKENEKK